MVVPRRELLTKILKDIIFNICKNIYGEKKRKLYISRTARRTYFSKKKSSILFDVQNTFQTKYFILYLKHFLIVLLITLVQLQHTSPYRNLKKNPVDPLQYYCPNYPTYHIFLYISGFFCFFCISDNPIPSKETLKHVH